MSRFILRLPKSRWPAPCPGLTVAPAQSTVCSLNWFNSLKGKVNAHHVDSSSEENCAKSQCDGFMPGVGNVPGNSVLCLLHFASCARTRGGHCEVSCQLGPPAKHAGEAERVRPQSGRRRHTHRFLGNGFGRSRIRQRPDKASRSTSAG